VGGRETYVAGAPRKMRNFGQVLLYVQGTDKLDLQFAFTGQQIASGFGFALTVADFNADGCAAFVTVPNVFVLEKEKNTL